MSYTNGLDKPSDYFETVTYSGNGTGQDITTLDFQPDWLWIKRRNAVGSHRIQDSIRGTTNYLQSDKTDAEASGGDVDAFLSNGFSLSGGATAYNVSGGTYVGWSWLGGGTGVSNTDGSITSTVSANTTSGFSIVSYTGTGSASDSVGHGLSKTPGMIFVKRRDSAGDWRVWHQNLSATTGKNLRLNTTDAEDSNISFFYSQPPNATTFRPGSGGNTNSSSATYIAYCFAPKKGFSAMGQYTGNGNADGPFIYTGFKPAFVLQKRSDSTSNWHIFDNKREPENVMDKFITTNDNASEGTATGFDFLSNGFKSRTSNFWNNQSGGTYIYMCFSENPFVTSTGIPTTAR